NRYRISRGSSQVGEKGRVAKHSRYQIVVHTQLVHLVSMRVKDSSGYVDAFDPCIEPVLDANRGSLVHLVAEDLSSGHDIIVGRGGRRVLWRSASQSCDKADSNQRRVHVVIGNGNAVDAISRLRQSCPDLDASEGDARIAVVRAITVARLLNNRRSLDAIRLDQHVG